LAGLFVHPVYILVTNRAENVQLGAVFVADREQGEIGAENDQEGAIGTSSRMPDPPDAGSAGMHNCAGMAGMAGIAGMATAAAPASSPKRSGSRLAQVASPN
jgi:hypothetical protein